MTHRPAPLIVPLLLSAATAAAAEDPVTHGLLTWRKLPALPDREGFAGMFAGVADGRLIAAGGANFPDGYPWEGGRKVWHDTVFVLDRPGGEWRRAEGRLPRTLGYGVSAGWDGRLIVAGGETGPTAERPGPQCRAEVFAVSVGPDGSLRFEDLPPLPKPAAHTAGAMIGPRLYVAGGVESPEAAAALHTFWVMDLSAPPESRRWVELPPWPGPGRMQAVAAVQAGSLFLFGGIALTAGPDGAPQRAEPYLRDAYRYTPGPDDTGGRPGRWTRIADMPEARAAAPSPAIASGASHVVVVGGTAETHQRLDRPTHPGWPTGSLTYHAVTDTWVTRPDEVPPGASRVTAPTAVWGGAAVIVGGERSPGKRSPDSWAVSVEGSRTPFGWLNYTALTVYLLGVVGIGLAFAFGSKTTDDFFRGGGRVPWWAAGLSIFATMLSSITFMAVPAAAFVDGWRNFLVNSYLLITPLVVFVYLPFYRRLDVTSAYEYLERRFNLAARLTASLLFMGFQGGRVAVVLFLPSLALATVTDLDVVTCIVLMGAASIVYTVFGGIEAVVWTDVVQAVVLLGGAVLSLALVLGRIDDGAVGVVRTVAAEGRFLGSVSWGWTWEHTAASAWVILIGSIFNNLLPYTAGQDVVQRYVTVPDQPAAARAIWLNAILSLPANALFFCIGSALLAFYKAHPDRLDPAMANDAVFPLFIVRELPAGIAGIVIAGVFAAAQSTISSSLNSIAACWVTDFHRRLRPGLSDRHCVRVAQAVTVIVGAAGTGLAVALAALDIRTLYDVFLEILGLFGGTVSALFALGIFTRRASGTGAMIGAAASAAAVTALKASGSVGIFVYAPTGFLVCMAVGYAASLLRPDTGRDLTGLTIHTPPAAAAPPGT